mmetsp:Transcript_10228/g.21917  ORF Transcript_10228/g.21917 Transcript_10228/m.21917 type:complete len:391 (+) Transcript_10228:296-1468(+)|eukprot:CAMPEP_0202890374 /NCGR_PEP_ID=MMETSP1392-20130828/798_1 /ASSEMBLY_ACC=CAM_ASM_000868 /TAXON_ID=225041 /ORGANISM="Chlamydomonas chlamydogama, Strain SAG 11-48b" /LENGTH=390 /DNA_ID=CAMNT_0049573929 /DNA_START=296 /DNA_END=1468 /DNA_ORIENTATION=+
MTQAGTLSAREVFDLRHYNAIPEGKCVYIQSGDPGDFDGYLIGVAGTELEKTTHNLQFVLVVPERRACADRTEANVNAHDEEYSEEVLMTSGQLFRLLCPRAFIVRGPLNLRNVIPLKFIFSEPDKYGPLLRSRATGMLQQHTEGVCLPGLQDEIYWRSVKDLADLINNPSVTSVVVDMNGSMGYLKLLLELVPTLGTKLKASGMPVTIMAGVLAEAEAGTLRVPGRDPRSTMNALYHPDAVKALLNLAQQHGLPLLFITNNVCNNMLCFEDSEVLTQQLLLQGILRDVAKQWYGPHLKGKCVPFDWVSFTAMLLHNRFPDLLKLQKRELWVGMSDSSVLVLRDPQLPTDSIVQNNLEGTQLWGVVDSVIGVDKSIMLDLARHVAQKHVI